MLEEHVLQNPEILISRILLSRLFATQKDGFSSHQDLKNLNELTDKLRPSSSCKLIL